MPIKRPPWCCITWRKAHHSPRRMSREARL